ncbi:MAG: cyclodeaminase/cyclohydrolase family protein [Candidatus Limnocylindrales bacterium]
MTTSFSQLPVGDFLARLASADPTPGGGSASAVAGAMAASLLTMVAALSVGRPKYAPYASTLERAAAVGTEMQARLLALADDDARAYDAFAAALKLPRDAPEEVAERTAAIRAASRTATAVPMEIVRACRTVVDELESLAGRSNLNAASDLVVGALLIDAAARGAAANVFINLPSVGDSEFEDRALLEVTGALSFVEDLAAEVRLVVGAGHLRDPEGV